MVLSPQQQRILERMIAQHAEKEAQKIQQNRKGILNDMLERGKDAAYKAAEKLATKLNEADAKFDTALVNTKTKVMQSASLIKSAFSAKAEEARKAFSQKNVNLSLDRQKVQTLAQQTQSQRSQALQKAEQRNQQIQLQKSTAERKVMQQMSDRMKQGMQEKRASEIKQRIEARIQGMQQPQKKQEKLPVDDAMRRYAANVKDSARAFEQAKMEKLNPKLAQAMREKAEKVNQNQATKVLESKPFEQVKAKQTEQKLEQAKERRSFNPLEDVVKRGSADKAGSLQEKLQRSAESIQKRFEDISGKTDQVKDRLSDIKKKAGEAIVPAQKKLEQQGKERDAAYKSERANLTNQIENLESRQAARDRQAAEAARNAPKWRKSGDLEYSENNDSYRKKNAKGEMDYYRQNSSGDYEFDHQRTSRIKAEAELAPLREQREKAEMIAEKQKIAELTFDRNELDASYQEAVKRDQELANNLQKAKENLKDEVPKKDESRAQEAQKTRESIRPKESPGKAEIAAKEESKKNIQDTKAEVARKQAETMKQDPKQGSKQAQDASQQEKKVQQRPEASNDKEYARQVSERAQGLHAEQQKKGGPLFDGPHKDSQEKKENPNPNFDASKRARNTESSGTGEQTAKKQASENVTAHKEQQNSQNPNWEDEFSQFKKKR